jgi:hypothetical protein
LGANPRLGWCGGGGRHESVEGSHETVEQPGQLHLLVVVELGEETFHDQVRRVAAS